MLWRRSAPLGRQGGGPGLAGQAEALRVSGTGSDLLAARDGGGGVGVGVLLLQLLLLLLDGGWCSRS